MLRRPSPIRAAIAVATVCVMSSSLTPVSAQEPALEVFYRRLDPKEPFKYVWKGKAANSNAGVFRWEVPETEFGTNGMDRNFTGYCAEVLVPITAEKTYRFRTNSIYDVGNYGLKADDDKAPLVAQRRARYIQELFGRYYRDPVANAVGSDEAVAFQVALWELIQETEPAEGEAKRDLFGGDFRADYVPADAPAFVRTAQSYLDSLTGNDALFYENPALRGRELVRLMGIANAEGLVAQSQFALRYTGGGATGVAGGAVAVGGAGGLVGGGVGAPVGGVGGFGGGAGGGGFTTGTGTNSSSSSTPGSSTVTTPILGAPTVTTSTPPVGGPNTTPPPVSTISTPPIGGPNDTNPVPAPPAVLLGLIAVGTLGSWRLGSRLLGRK